MKQLLKGAGLVKILIAVIVTLLLSGISGIAQNETGDESGSQVLRSMKYESMSKEEAVLWQKDLRERLFDLLKMSDLIWEDTNIPFNVKTLSVSDEGSYDLFEKTMNSTNGRRINFVMTVPKNGEGPFPAIVLLSGHGGTRHNVYEEESIYNIGGYLASDYVTLSVKVSQHEIYEEGRTLMGERLWDCMRCVDYLVSCDDVDTDRIGCGGLSLGGEMTMWLGAMDERIKASLVAGFLTTMDQMEVNHCMCWNFPGLRALVDFSDIYAMHVPRSLCFLNGIDEPPTHFPPALAVSVFNELAIAYMDFEVAENVSLVVHKGGHIIHVPTFVQFFDYQLRNDETH